LRDAIGRTGNCGGLQVDLNLPERIGAFTSVPIGEKARSSYACTGHFWARWEALYCLFSSGASLQCTFPLWLAPLQIMIADQSRQKA